MLKIEEEIFQRKRFVLSKMEDFGFRKNKDQYFYEADFVNGDFHLLLSVSLKGEVSSKVIDKMNNEEYTQISSENFNGAYVNSVRKSYRELLNSIGQNVCEDVLFASDQANRISGIILKQFEVKPDFPWEQTQYQSYGTFRHADSKKWFALIMNVEMDKLLKNGDTTTVDIINLKSDSSELDRKDYPKSIYPSYHMNHKTWISIVLNDSMDDDTLMSFIQRSYNLT